MHHRGHRKNRENTKMETKKVTVHGIFCGSMCGTYNMLWFYDIFRRSFRQFLVAIVTKTPYFVGFQPVNGYEKG